MKKKFISPYLLMALAVVAMPSHSAENGTSLILEEIVVTAQKREESAQDVGISITAFSGDQLEKLGFQTTTDIVTQTPGLQLYEFSPSITVYNVRGVSQNSFSDNLEGPVAVYIDDAYISALGAQNQPLFDVERVEILKGPQGTLYGRNATGGLIHYISRKPTEETEFNISASIGSFGYHEVEAAASGALSDKVRARIAFVDTQEDGYLESTNPAVRDAYGKNAQAVKAFIEIDLSDSAKLTLNPYWSEDSDVPTGGYVRINAAQDPVTGLAQASPSPADPFSHSSDLEGRFDREIKGLTTKVEWDFAENISFTSITSIQDMEKFYEEDSEGRNLTIGDIIGAPFPPEINALGVFGFRTNQDFEQLSQEIRFEGSSDNLNWQAGAFYLDIEQSNFGLVEGLAAFFGPNAVNGQFFTQARNDFNLEAKSLSVFAQGDFQVSDRVKVIAGLRYVDDDKDFDAYIRYQDPTGFAVVGFGPPVAPGVFDPICYSQTVDARCAGDVADSDANFGYSDVAGKLQVEYTIGNDGLFYAGINRGTKGGNWATPSFPDSVRANGLSSLAHTEETLWSYEAGYKTSILDGAGRFNAAVFYYDYEDYQAFSLTNFVQNITNNDATVTGAEFELAFSPLNGLDILFGGSLLDTEVEDIATPFGVIVDTELPNAPSVSLNGLVRYAWSVGGGDMSAQVDFNYNGEQYLEVTNPESSLEDSYTVANLRVGYAPSDHLDVSLWVRNATDEEYRIYSLDVAGAPAPFINDVFARPRTYGATVSYKF